MVGPVRRTTRRRRPWGTIVIVALIAVVLGWVVFPLSMGKPIPDPRVAIPAFFTGDVLAAEKNNAYEAVPPGKVRVFISGRAIPAYSKIKRDDLWNPAKNTWAHSDVSEDLVEQRGILFDAKEIVGRVLAHDKAPGYAFTEKDFLPKGTRPGLSAGIPAGKRALRIDVEKVHGIVGLQPGDRFDMVSALAVDQSKTAGLLADSYGGVFTEQLKRQAQMNNLPQARVRVLVQNGIVVTPLQTRGVPTTNTSLTRGTSVRTLPVQEMVIALDPEEVAPFLEALSVEANITCLARSGRPDDPLDSVTPSSEPTPLLFGPGGLGRDSGGGMSIIESIDDTKREFVPVPSAPVVQVSGGSEG